MKEMLNLTMDEIASALRDMGEKPYRAGQVFAWLHRGATFDEMSNLPLSLRERLKEDFIDQPVSIRAMRVSDHDGTRKFLFSLPDGNCVEGVLMHYKYGDTLCLSTQVGCRMGCLFCASGLNGRVRDLTGGEMLGQVLCANRYARDARVHNIVLMGSGEPLDNYDNTVRFLRLVSDEKGINIGIRHISLSTCGLAPEVLRFAGEGLPVTLSLSLHAPNDAIRQRIMPIAHRYAIDETLAACRTYVEKTGRRLVVEYALIGGVNDSDACADELASRLRNLQCHVNLIPLNAVPERKLNGVSEETVRRFLDRLTMRRISATRRREMGDDIEGACGQLRRKTLGEGSP